MRALIIVLLNIFSFCAIAQMSLNEQIDSLEQVVSRIRTELNKKDGELSEVLSQLKAVKNEKLLDSIGSQEQYITAKLNMMGRLKEEGRAGSVAIKTIASRSSVKLINFSEGYWYVNYEDSYGFLSEMYFMETEEMKSFKEALIQQNKLLEKQNNELKSEQTRITFQEEMSQRKAEIDSIYNAKNEEKRKMLIAKYGKSLASKLLEEGYWIGMTDEMARDSLGDPKDINRSSGSWGFHEQWVYENQYLYFENGILKSYQN